jgi:type IV secretion system protein VirB9
MFKHILFIAAITALSFNSSVVFAEEKLVSSTKDSRIKYVSYDQANVVKLNLTRGILTQIVLEDGEQIANIAFGEGVSWQHSEINNNVFIKPELANANYTNAIIITNKRTYSLDLNACHKNCTNPIYKVIYTYNSKNGVNDNENSKSDKELEQEEQDIAKKILKNTKSSKPSKLDASNDIKNNYQYTAQGEQSIKPLDTWDDGKFTYLKFVNFKALPAIYTMKDKEPESLTNWHVENKSTIVIHQLAPMFILRAGTKVLAVHNENYKKQQDANADTGRSISNTISKFVERVISNESN